jgi:hypothetical protein
MFLRVMHGLGAAAVVATVLVFFAYGVLLSWRWEPENQASSAQARIETIFTRIKTTIVTITHSRPVIVSFIVVLVVSVICFRGFVFHHPGVVLVFLGVAGETIWDSKEEFWSKTMGRISAWVLVLGLVVEMGEAVAGDKENSEIKERAAKLEDEAAKARLELGRIKPENRPIRSMRANVYLSASGGSGEPGKLTVPPGLTFLEILGSGANPLATLVLTEGGGSGFRLATKPGKDSN